MPNEKPFITYSGEESPITESLSSQITRDLPQEGIEWQRSYGRSSKIVYLEAQLVQMTDAYLQINDNDMQLSLLSKPLLHTYWTDCNDIETYKTVTRDMINSWMTKLKDNGITDWFIIHIDNTETRKGINKSKLLPRSSVLDKIRSDFPTVKSGAERCVTLIDPQRSDTKASESYQQFLHRLRLLLLQSYSRQLVKYEDYVRSERENRTSLNWNFFEFFFLQEELAFAFEMLSLYDEALVQYDELDALFTQFVINSNVGEIPEWLLKLSENCDTWHGLCLSPGVSKSLRVQFQNGKGTLLDLRNYLFSRQCELLILLNKPWELASRSLPFLQNCVNELNMLEITVMSGGIACWVFISALEILQKCERYSDSSQMETYSLHTVGLWAYARNKLAELGSLCGLMPGMKVTSECLHITVSLIAGMGQDPRLDQIPLSPQGRLKEALSGSESFLKHYLEISELTMGTYKHIGRMRCARMIGKELAHLYMKLKNPQKALPFLIDNEKLYVNEKWNYLLSNIRESLLQCYQMLEDYRKECRVRCQLSACPLLSLESRISHFNFIENFVPSNESSEKIIININEIFEVQNFALQLDNNVCVTNSDIALELVLLSNLPNPIECEEFAVSLKSDPLPLNFSKKNKLAFECTHNTASVNSDPNEENDNLQIETFHTSISVGIKCNNSHKLLKRSESHGLFHYDKDIEEDNFDHSFVAHKLIINSGVNVIKLNFKSQQSASYTLNQLRIKWNSNVTFLSSPINKHICFNIIAEEPSLKVLQLTTLDGATNDIIAGVEQSIVLQLNSGSSNFEEGLCFVIRASRGLMIKLETDITTLLKDEISIQLSNALTSFQTFTIPLIIKAKLFPQKDMSSVEHQLTLCWEPKGTNVPKTIGAVFYLLPSFITSFKLHTCNTRKFIEILVYGVTKSKIILSDPILKISDDVSNGITLSPRLPKDNLILNKDQTAHYLWELIANETSIIANKALFSIKYNLMNETNITEPKNWEYYESDLKLNNYQTLYTINENVEPQKGTEFCRVGTLCHLNVIISKVNTLNDHSSLMYEIVADQTMWNMSGRTAGVIAIDQSGKYEITFEVMPLISGFLPLPTVRLSKYISSANSNISNEKPVPGAHGNQHEAKLIAFDIGQVYNWNRATQVHVLPSSGLIVSESQF